LLLRAFALEIFRFEFYVALVVKLFVFFLFFTLPSSSSCSSGGLRLLLQPHPSDPSRVLAEETRSSTWKWNSIETIRPSFVSLCGFVFFFFCLYPTFFIRRWTSGGLHLPFDDFFFGFFLLVSFLSAAAAAGDKDGGNNPMIRNKT